jgi:hypothetical protein
MKRSTPILFWMPRIICILAILFVSIFALDAFSEGLTIWQQIGGFLIHLIPSFVLLAFLILAWKKEFAGGILFIGIGVVMSTLLFYHNYKVNHFSVGQSILIVLMLALPFIIAGVLFLLSYYDHKKPYQSIH